MTIRDSNYITVLAPMITKLQLKGNELLIFSLIHGFSQDGESRFKGSIKYLNQWTGLNKTTIISILKKLVDLKYIQKYEYEENRIKHCEYVSNYFEVLGWLENPTTPRLENTTGGGCEIQPGVVVKSNPILIDNNTIILEEKEPGEKAPDSLFPEIEPEKVDKSKKTLFSNSVYKDYDTFVLKFKSPEYENVDLFHYYTSVKNWSDKKDMKRTARGWIATAQDFMRGDIEKQKLKLKPEFQNTKQSQTYESMMEYLNSMQ